MFCDFETIAVAEGPTAYRCKHCGIVRGRRVTRACSRKGPGDFLHDAIKRWTGADLAPGCNCQEHIQHMNEWGPAECKRRLPEIRGWLREEAANRGWLIAIAAGFPGVKFFIRRMILNAIEESEKASG